MLAHIPNSVDPERNASNLKLTLRKQRNRLEYDSLNAEMQATENGPLNGSKECEKMLGKVGDHILKGTYVIAITIVPPILNLSSYNPPINKLILSSLGGYTAFTVEHESHLLHTSTTVLWSPSRRDRDWTRQWTSVISVEVGTYCVLSVLEAVCSVSRSCGGVF